MSGTGVAFTLVMRAFLLLVPLIAGCGGDASSTNAGANGLPPPAPSVRRATFRADPATPAPSEAYICYALDVEGIDRVHLGRVTWHPPSGPAILHHASLYAATGLPQVGEVPCDPMPTRCAALGVYTPGIEPLQLPAGSAIYLPPGTRRLLVLAHVLRVADGPANPTYVDLELAAEPVQHSVNWVDVFAPVPYIFPQQAARSVGSCRFAVSTHIVSVWAHMHRLGTQFHGVIVRKDGTREPLVDVSPWDFNHQLIYPADVQLEPGDSVETQCNWFNPTADVVTPGPYSTNEMCNQGILVWPFDSAICAP